LFLILIVTAPAHAGHSGFSVRIINDHLETGFDFVALRIAESPIAFGGELFFKPLSRVHIQV
jgi:hypothetical protein